MITAVKSKHNKEKNTADVLSTCILILSIFLVNFNLMYTIFTSKGKTATLQTWRGPEGSRKLRFPDFMTTAQDGGKVVSLTHRPPLP